MRKDGSTTAMKFDGSVATPTLSVTGRLNPGTDNTYLVGLASMRWSGGNFGTAITVTSDERMKQQIQDIHDAVLDAWAAVDYKQYKFCDAVELKGSDAARWHFGVIAQRIKDVFDAAGIDAFEYGLLCHDVWAEQAEVMGEDGIIETPYQPAGERYGVRYEEAHSLELALLRRTTRRLELRLAALENA
jgi:hypothetical protein